MSDEQENVDAGSETSGDQADTAQAETTQPAAPETAQADQGADSAGGAADETQTTDVAVDGSRTGFVENGQSGGECICPDGRKGTIHKFDAGLVCIPNDNQG